MDPESLRWSLLIIGAVLIIAVYAYGRHQVKLRNRAAIKTFTQDEMEEPYIDDITLRLELESLDEVLADDKMSNFEDININPAMEVEESTHAKQLSLLDEVEEEKALENKKEDDQSSNLLVSYLLKKSDDSALNNKEIRKLLIESGFTKDGFEYLFKENGEELFLVTIRESAEIKITQTIGVCFILDKTRHGKSAKTSYETMLKVIDKLTQALNVKVYNDDLTLLGIDDITTVRKKLITEEKDQKS